MPLWHNRAGWSEFEQPLNIESHLWSASLHLSWPPIQVFSSLPARPYTRLFSAEIFFEMKYFLNGNIFTGGQDGGQFAALSASAGLSGDLPGDLLGEQFVAGGP